MGRKPDTELTDEEAFKRLFPREVREAVDAEIDESEEDEDEEESGIEE